MIYQSVEVEPGVLFEFEGLSRTADKTTRVNVSITDSKENTLHLNLDLTDINDLESWLSWLKQDILLKSQ